VGAGIRSADNGVSRVGVPLKILDLTEFYSPEGGGVRTYLAAKAEWLSRRDDLAHSLVVPGKADGCGSISGSTLHTIRGPAVPGSPGYHVLRNAGRLSRILDAEQPDIVELGSGYSAPWLLRRASRRRTFAIVGFMHMDLREAVRLAAAARVPAVAGIATRIAERYARTAYAACDALVVSSDATRDSVLRAGLPDPVVVPMGVNLARFRPDLRTREWRTEVGIQDDRPVGLYVGRLAAEKQVDWLAHALPELRRRTGLTLVMLGEGRLRRRLEALERRHPEVIRVRGFEADRARLARAYASADVFLAPDAHETFGLATLEAAASGLPVVGAAGGAVGERLADAPWGRTFTPGDPASLAEATQDVLSRDRDLIGRAARQWAERYSWDRTFSRLLDVYRTVLE
jgi:alpha-1,6-mannosyltransferase